VGIREWEIRMRIVGSRARRKFDDEGCGTTDVWVEGREWDIDMNIGDEIGLAEGLELRQNIDGDR
jgi:hypothetical protein